MPSLKEKSDKPIICIFTTSGYKDSELVAQIGYGIEEEGIPFRVCLQQDNNIEKLAYYAAQKSSLGVGVGVGSGERVILQMKKLKQDSPVFDKIINKNSQAKKMGSNAARMVKGLPFKSFATEE
ncbi:glycerol dehydratase reactivase beta/small subunit family protein [Halanaerobaculum tunisiense]